MNAETYRRLQDKPIRSLLKRVRQWFLIGGVPHTDEQVLAMARSLIKPMQVARQANYAIAATYLTSQGIPKADIPALEPYEVKVLRDVIGANVERQRAPDGEPVSRANHQDILVVKTAQKAAEGSLQRHAQAPARETVAEVAETTEGIGWARMLVGPSSCSFCAMLASRGPVYSSEQAALGRGGSPLTVYHTAYLNKNGKLVGGNCDCIAVLVKDRSWEGWDAAFRLEGLWEETTSRASNSTARNAFRREWDRKVRSGGTGEYLAESVRPPGGA